HWHSPAVKSYVETPHTFVYGKNQGNILNLTAKEADITRSGILTIAQEDHSKMLTEIKKLIMPSRHNLTAKDVDLKRLGSVLALAHEQETKNFESLLLLKGLGPRTLQSLALVSEVIHGTPTRFSDPARFSFAHGGKDGHPFPVPLKVYDETINTLKSAVEKARIGNADKSRAIEQLSKLSSTVEKSFIPDYSLDDIIKKERKASPALGGRAVFDDHGKRIPKKDSQLKLF